MSARKSIRHLFLQLRHGGLKWLTGAIYNRLWPAKPVMTPVVIAAVQNLTGLELGGPSRVFSAGKILPLYPCIQRLDNVNFSSQTAWEAGLREGGDFRFAPNKQPGRQFLREATALAGITDASYDFVLSCHCLEHCANPLAALREWRRIAREGGHLLLILPNPRHTFDHRRPTTTLSHLREDFRRQTGEDDLTHLPEILAQHDLALDPPAGSPEQFRNRAMLNAQNRCLHHHVFDLALMRAMLAETGWDVLALEEVRPIHLVALARKAPIL
jgi:SAM-dependent methyltransferase